MALPALPPLIPATFRWHPSPNDPRTVQRLANGTEAWVGIKDANAKGQYNNYLNTTLRIAEHGSLSLATLKEYLAAALVHIRFQHPEVACTAVWGEKGPPHIQYTPPSDTTEALEWAHNTIETRCTSLSGLKFREELVKQRREAGPVHSKSLSVWILADVPEEQALLAPDTVVDVLMYFNHIYWDGISSRAFMGELLTRFGHIWNANDRVGEYEWGNEISNLSEPILDACRVDVDTLGDEFNKTREEFITSLISSGSSWGLPVTDNEGTPRTEWHSLSKAESDAIIRAIKARLGSQYTITHLGHAATVLALLKANPLSDAKPDDTALITALPVNGRRYLQDKYTKKQYGACQAPAVVEFPNLKSWKVDENDTDALKATLERGCRHIKQWYDYWLGKEFNLAMGVSKDNFLAEFLSSTPLPFTGSAVPVFCSDGIVDRYVPGEVVSTSEEKLMTVDNCVFFLDTYQTAILIRMDSWKGATAFSICFDDGYYGAEDASQFLKYIADFMLAFAQ